VLRRRFVVFALTLGLLVPGSARPENSAAPRLDTIAIETPQDTHILTVEIADTPALRERGLMFRHRLAENRGMLFLYERPHPVAMWMKNTYITLDMAFVRADGTVSEVVSGTIPHSLDTIRSSEPVRAVLEIAAGEAARLGLAAGAVVRHPFFGNAE
jgi:uncharacterized protein